MPFPADDLPEPTSRADAAAAQRAANRTWERRVHAEGDRLRRARRLQRATERGLEPFTDAPQEPPQ